MSDLAPRRRQNRQEQKAETRARLMDAAEELFIRKGIGDTSLEEIAAAAGYSRGAFYSNFADRNELVFELLERHQRRSMSEIQGLMEGATPDGFIERLRVREIGHSNEQAALFMEYVLFTTRHPDGLARLKTLNDEILDDIEGIARLQYERMGVELPIDARTAAKIVLALDEGYALLRLIDPDAFPMGIWGESMAFLSEAVTALIEKRS